MARTDNDAPPIKDELDESLQSLSIPMFAIEGMLELSERPLEVTGLYFFYLIHLKKHGRIPSIKELTAMGCGSAQRLAAIRKEAKEQGYLEEIFARKDGKIVARRTRLTSPKIKSLNAENLNLRKPAYNTFINKSNNTPDSERTESGRVSSDSGNTKEIEKTPKEFPRLQDFNTLWSSNKHKTNKVECKKAWESKPVQSSLPPINVLVEAYEADAKANKWDSPDMEKKFIPHLSTWLRGRRWENHTGEVVGVEGGIHIMQQLKRVDGIQDGKQLRKELNHYHVPLEKRGKGVMPKTAIRAYTKWLEGPDPPPATAKHSIKDVLIYTEEDTFYWKAYVEAGMPGLTKKEMF